MRGGFSPARCLKKRASLGFNAWDMFRRKHSRLGSGSCDRVNLVKRLRQRTTSPAEDPRLLISTRCKISLLGPDFHGVSSAL